jgi:hypothetical protein
MIIALNSGRLRQADTLPVMKGSNILNRFQQNLEHCHNLLDLEEGNLGICM